MHRASYYLLDVFTEQRYGGNPLAIFPDARPVDPSLMQTIAGELNLSETVFLYPRNKKGAFPMRIFTPRTELPTAGHPSIGTAFFLAREVHHDHNKPIEIILGQRIGDIRVSVEHRYNIPTMATMHQPLPEFGEVMETRKEVAAVLGLKEQDLLPQPLQIVSCGVPYLIVPINSLEAVKAIRFRLDLWDRMKDAFGGSFIYAFTPSGERPGSDLHGRMFAPEAGILEDPATGSANGPLACYCVEYGIKKGPMISEQGFEMGRPSFLHLEARKDGNEFKSVRVAGKSVFVGKGEFFLD